jgi:hypothetical protein
MTVYDNTHTAVQEHKLRAQLDSTAHKAKLARQLIRHLPLTEVQALFGGGYVTASNEAVHHAGNLVSDETLADLLPRLQAVK